MRRGPGTVYRRLESLRFALTRDRNQIARFVSRGIVRGEIGRRLRLLAAFERVTHRVRGYHALAEMLRVADDILARPKAVVVEAGCGHGSSTAKLSLAVREVGGHLHVFDSFRGLPENAEVHEHLDGRTIRFREGAFRARKSAVERIVARYGAIEVCTFHKGWFAETLPGFSETVDVALLDVDLVESTRCCLVHVFPNLSADGVVFSQDGHIRGTVELLRSPRLWSDEVKVAMPAVRGLGTDKLIEIRPAYSQNPACTSRTRSSTTPSSQ